MLERVKPGDPLSIPAGTFNSILDATDDYLARAAGRTAPNAQRPVGSVLVRNDTSLTLPRGAVLGISEPLILPNEAPGNDVLAATASRWAFKGRAPTAADLHRPALLVDGLGPGQIGPAVISGLAIARVNVAGATGVTAAVARPSDTNALVPGPGSCRVLWQAGTSGVVECIVLLGERSDLFRVNLTVTGGTFAGDSSNYCTFTYTVSSASGAQLATAVPLATKRLIKATYIAATGGLAYWETDGVLKLWWCDEQISQTNCT